jgi:ubiquinone/menaquinone biosynthesis C-methylase UbiE
VNVNSDRIISSIKESYDALAEDYSRRISNELSGKPLDRELLKRFSTCVKHGTVCELGCGPGHVASFLHELGTNIFGIDISPNMISEARKLHHEIQFKEGNMLSLDIQNSSLAGVVSFYAICNIPKPLLTKVFNEMSRILEANGLALIAFHSGSKETHESELWGNQISLDFFFYEPSMISRMLEHSGFLIEDVVERQPYAPDVEYQSKRAYIFARKRNY